MVDVIAYVDTTGRHRQVYRLHRGGVFIGEYKTPDELGQHVDLATLTVEESDS